MTIRALDHIAVAVSDLERAIRRFADDFGLDLEGTEDVPSARTSTAFFPIPGTRIELVHPLQGQGPIAKYLDKRGKGGLHHVAFETDDIIADMQRLKDKGYRLLSDEPKPGAHGSQTVFVHPSDCDGVLIELVQHGPGGPAHD